MAIEQCQRKRRQLAALGSTALCLKPKQHARAASEMAKYFVEVRMVEGVVLACMTGPRRFATGSALGEKALVERLRAEAGTSVELPDLAGGHEADRLAAALGSAELVGRAADQSPILRGLYSQRQPTGAGAERPPVGRKRILGRAQAFAAIGPYGQHIGLSPAALPGATKAVARGVRI